MVHTRHNAIYFTKNHIYYLWQTQEVSKCYPSIAKDTMIQESSVISLRLFMVEWGLKEDLPCAKLWNQRKKHVVLHYFSFLIFGLPWFSYLQPCYPTKAGKSPMRIWQRALTGQGIKRAKLGSQHFSINMLHLPCVILFPHLLKEGFRPDNLWVSFMAQNYKTEKTGLKVQRSRLEAQILNKPGESLPPWVSISLSINGEFNPNTSQILFQSDSRTLL